MPQRSCLCYKYLLFSPLESTLQQRNADFLAFLSSLNPDQQRAVEQTEGPVLVLAGPGTGKTQVLAARIGNILLTTDARPQNILCLTFTDAATHAMRQRLLTLIGPDAHRVPIMTYHAFCNRVIQENMEFFGRTDLELLTDLERIEIVRSILDKLPADHPLREGYKSAYQLERQLRNLFSAMKTEGWSPGHVLRSAKTYIDQLQDNEDFIYKKNTTYGKKGELKQEKIREEKDRMAKLSAAADLYPKYNAALQRAGRYEYADMLLWVLKGFEEHPMLLRTYQERYLYILVDEYQDTNGAQNQLLQHLANYWEKPNLFIVGDDDQSIYEFQGARLQNLVDFYNRYHQDLLHVVLTKNYRSVQPILDTASQLIGHNQLRAVSVFDEPVSKILVSQVEQLIETQSVHVHTYNNRLEETVGITQQISGLLQSGVSGADIAVLYARHKQSERLMTLLSKSDIAFQTRRPVDILRLPVIEQFRELLYYIDDELTRPFSGDWRLFRLLHAPFFGFNALDIARLGIQIRRSNDAGESVFWREMLDSNPIHPITENNTSVSAGLAHTFIAAAVERTPAQLIEYLYTHTGLLTWAMNQPDKIWYIQVLNTFLSFVQQENARTLKFSLSRLLTMLEAMEENKIGLPVQQQVQASAGVHLLTAHSAKGLEFKHVFIIDCTDEWEPGKRDSGSNFALPDTLTLSGEEDAWEARRRLFYVAMTRAKNQLYLSFAQNDDAGKPLQQARFIAEINIEKTPIPVAQEQIVAAQLRLLSTSAQPEITLPEAEQIQTIVEDYVLTISGFNRYLRCPIAFYYEDILQIRGAMHEAAAYGIAIHAALQQVVVRMKAHKKREWPAAAVLVKIFKHEMGRQRHYFSINSFDQRLALGEKTLTRYHYEQLPYWRKSAVVERRIDRAVSAGIPLSGIIDKIEFLDDGKLRIIDYKTSSPNKERTAAPSEQQPYGGEYWRQMAFYKILIEVSKLYTEAVSKGVIAWIEPDKKGVFQHHEIAITAAQQTQVMQWIQWVYTQIRERQFTVGCGKTDCIWCTMHRDRDLPAVLHRPEADLDDG